MVIRLATSQDKEQVFGLLDEFSLFIKAKDVPSQVGGEIFDEIMSRDDTKLFVVEEHGVLQGLASFYLLPSLRHGWHRGHIEDFFVSKRVRGKGVGSQMFEFIKEYCRKHTIKVVKLDSGNELIAAHHFYEKNGGKTSERFFRFDIE